MTKKEAEQIKIIEERVYKCVESYRDRSFNTRFYSMQRIDLIVVTLSTGGIIAILNMLDKLIVLSCCCAKTFSMLAVISFGLTIAFNLASQFSSHALNKNEADWADSEMDRLNKKIEVNQIAEYAYLKNLTTFLNRAGIVCLSIGFIFLSITLGSIIF